MTASIQPEPAARWAQLAVLAATVLLALVPWFSAAAVAPIIGEEWAIGSVETVMLTVAVQLGFVVGALVVAFTGAADVVPARRLMAGGALLAAVANAAFGLLATDLATALPLRALSGAGIAAVYPVAMKVLSGWFGASRGLGVGILIGAITLGSAMPHLFRSLGALAGLEWRSVVLAATAPLPCRRGRRLVRCSRGTHEHAGGASQPADGTYRARRAQRAAGEPRLPRPHVGAVRHVDLGAGLRGGHARAVG